ncbi:MAG: hypothetical protein U0903_01550 [Planctomycetales bacterium]
MGVPFDVAAFLAENEIPPDENAYRYYDQVTQRLNGEEYRKAENAWNTVVSSQTLKEARSWKDLSPEEQKAVQDLKPVFDVFLQGAQMERGYQHSIEKMSIDSLLPFAQNSRGLVVLAKGEAFRREELKDEAGGWECLRAAMRMTRHLTRGCEIEFRIAFMDMKDLGLPIWEWLLDDRRSTPLLRQAIKDLQWTVANTPPPSFQVKCNYVLTENILMKLGSEFEKLDHPSIMNIGTSQFPKPLQGPWRKCVFFGLQTIGEPKRVERLARQICKNRLSACDLPLQERTKLTPEGTPAIQPLFTVSASESKLLSPASLHAQVKSQLLPLNSTWFPWGVDFRDQDQVRLCSLILVAALQVHHRETGHYPEKLTELVPGILDALPDDPTVGHGQTFQYRRLKEGECQLWTSVGYGPDSEIIPELKKVQPDFEVHTDGGLTCILRGKKVTESKPQAK